MPGSRRLCGPPSGRSERRTQPKGAHHAGRHPAGAPRGGCALRPPDATVEPEDAAIPLRGAIRDLHHRSRAIFVRARGSARLRSGARSSPQDRPVHRDEEAGSGGRLRVREPDQHALRQQPLVGRHAHQLQHDPRPAAPSAGARRDGGDRGHGTPPQEGGDPPAARAGEARAEPRRDPEPRAAAGRDLRDRYEEGAHRRHRGSEAQHPRDRDRGYEL